MNRGRETLWTIDELGSKVAEALAFDYEGPPNDRVRDVPDRRTIRYYTTIGLVDRAAEMRGRTALYGRRHLMQLAAIKRLQAQGMSLAEVQRQLMGLTDSALTRLARLPAPLDFGSAIKPESGQALEGSRDLAFWKKAPAAFESESPAPAQSEKVQEGTKETVPPLQGIRLDEDTTLLIAAVRALDEKDMEAIHQAAEPLLKLLTKRGLLISPRKGER